MSSPPNSNPRTFSPATPLATPTGQNGPNGPTPESILQQVWDDSAQTRMIGRLHPEFFIEFGKFGKALETRVGNVQTRASRDKNSTDTPTKSKRRKTSEGLRPSPRTSATAMSPLRDVFSSPRWMLEVGGEDGSAQKIKKKLSDLLDEDLLPQAAGRKKQPARKAKTSRLFQEDFQENFSVQDSQGEVHKERGTKDGRSKFKVGTTVRQAMEHLYEYKNGGNKDDVDEKGHTQHVVNRLLQSIMPCLVDSLQQEISNYFGLGKSYGDNLELSYYAETKHHYEAANRLPDSSFFLRGKESGDPKLTKETQKIGMLVSVEHKTTVAKKIEDAKMECERDCAEKLKETDFVDPPIGYSIITDGIDWYFLRTKLCKKEGDRDYKMRTLWSPKVTIRKDEPEKDGEVWDFANLANWLLFILKRSLVEPKDAVKQKETTIFRFSDTCQLKTHHVLALNEARNRLVAEVSSVSTSKRYVLKFPFFSLQDEPTEHDLKEARRVLEEKENLRVLRGSDGIVATADLNVPAHVVLLENVGVGLDRVIVSGKAGKALARVVLSQIWEKALPALRKKDMCHADIHPGNICVSKDSGGALIATLVDLESARTVGVNLDAAPIMVRDEESLESWLRESSFQLDKIMVCSIMACLWNGSLQDLSGNVDRCAKGYKSDEGEEPSFVVETIMRIKNATI